MKFNIVLVATNEIFIEVATAIKEILESRGHNCKITKTPIQCDCHLVIKAIKPIPLKLLSIFTSGKYLEISNGR